MNRQRSSLVAVLVLLFAAIAVHAAPPFTYMSGKKPAELQPGYNKAIPASSSVAAPVPTGLAYESLPKVKKPSYGSPGNTPMTQPSHASTLLEDRDYSISLKGNTIWYPNHMAPDFHDFKRYLQIDTTGLILVNLRRPIKALMVDLFSQLVDIQTLKKAFQVGPADTLAQIMSYKESDLQKTMAVYTSRPDYKPPANPKKHLHSALESMYYRDRKHHAYLQYYYNHSRNMRLPQQQREELALMATLYDLTLSVYTPQANLRQWFQETEFLFGNLAEVIKEGAALPNLLSYMPAGEHDLKILAAKVPAPF